MRLACLALVLSASFAFAQQTDGTALVSAGFLRRAADTPEKVAILKSLPADKFVHRSARNGSHYYVYANHAGCRCAYVGGQQAMDNYRQTKSRALTPEQLGAGSNPSTNSVEENIVYGMQDDDFENQFNREAFDPDAAPGYVPGFRP